MSHHRRHRRPNSPVRYVALTVAAGLLLAGTGIALASGQDGPSSESDHPGVHRIFGRGNGTLASLTANPDCTLKVPDNPLTPRGLATPYVLHSAGLACDENNEGTAAFVQAVILEPGGSLFTYNPVVRNAGQALQGGRPPVPHIPDGSVVTIWTGFNGNVLKLTGEDKGAFVNFAQQSYANSPRFFAAAQAAGITAPPLGTGTIDGKTCPSVRSFSVVDQDQSDNVPVTYPAYGTSNGSDDNLITYIDAAIGCTPWAVPSLSQPGSISTAGPLEEIQAAQNEAAPQALVPSGDPFVTAGGQPSLFLQNLYRIQVDQPLTAGNDTAAYCQNLAMYGAPRLQADASLETGPAPQFTDPNLSLATVLHGRFDATWVNLACGGTPPY